MSAVAIGILFGSLVAAVPGANEGMGAPGTTGTEPPATTGADNPRTTDFDTPVATPLTGVKPLLVVLMEFSDVAHNAAVTPAYVQNQIFGPRPSLNDYYLETSYGLYSFSDQGNWAWVPAWDDPATSGDESTRAYWNAFPDPTYAGGTFQRWGLVSLDQAGYNFAPLDVNGDGKITFGPEVAYLLIDAQVVNARGGATRSMPPGLTLDGKTVEGACAGVSGDSPWITLYAHELAHESSWGGWFLTDYYGIQPQNIGQFSLMGFSAYSNASGGWQTPIGPVHLDPLSKLKEGWYSGTTVAADGWFTIPDAETNPSAYILYDSSHGKDEYFMVENRWRGSSYDAAGIVPALTAPLPPADASAGIPDEGLLIWHVDETRDWNGTSTGGFAKIALERRDGSDGGAAFDGTAPGYYDFWDGSTTTNAQWNGGGNSKTGVWCVSGPGATVRAYLDVPGPGVLICSGPLSASAVPGSAGTVSVPIRNTGDVADTYAISVLGPGDVIATVPAPVTVGAKTETTVTVSLTPIRACTTAPGPRSLTIVATSTLNAGVSDSVAATLTVLPYGDPSVSVATVDGDVEPGMTGTYDLTAVNNGNAFDTMTLTFTGVDFGTAYRAIPTAIPNSWVAFNPADPTAAACGSDTSVLSITVPPDWAAMEDATYQFVVQVMSSIDGATNTATGHLIVRATPLSRMYFVRAECEALNASVAALPPSDVRDGLLNKTMAACAKFDQAMARYVAGEDPPASNLFRTTQNILAAFLNQADAQHGKALTDAQWTDLTTQAQQIRADIDTILSLI